MKSAEKFYRRCHEEALSVVERLKADPASKLTPGDASTLSLAVGALKDTITVLAAHEAQAKARRERIQWVSAGPDLHVAAIGRLTARLRWSGTGAVGRVWMHNGAARVHDLGTVASIEGASRKVRAWRKAQRRAS